MLTIRICNKIINSCQVSSATINSGYMFHAEFPHHRATIIFHWRISRKLSGIIVHFPNRCTKTNNEQRITIDEWRHYLNCRQWTSLFYPFFFFEAIQQFIEADSVSLFMVSQYICICFVSSLFSHWFFRCKTNYAWGLKFYAKYLSFALCRFISTSIEAPNITIFAVVVFCNPYW